MSEDRPQFDSLLGGTVEVPIELNIMNFSSARAQEIAALTMAIEDPQRSGLIFQKLPRHMRRRVMSHNAKRMPRRLREAYAQQLAKTGPQPTKKRPSRKYRRRPGNLLEEYNRRQRTHVWLETHIWHAKRFHMTERWGYRLAHFPNDRSYRACYRATANHCLLQDISFLCCVELTGPLHFLLNGLMQHTDSCVGLTFSAQSFLDGKREGEVMFYESQRYPHGAIGIVSFLWKPLKEGCNSNLRTVWLWMHPGYYQQALDALIQTFSFNALCVENNYDTHMDADSIVASSTDDVTKTKLTHPTPAKQKKTHDKKVHSVEEIKLATRNVPFDRTPKYVSKCGNVEMILLKDTFNRFRLTGPLSHSVLQECLSVFTGKHISTKMDVNGDSVVKQVSAESTPQVLEENKAKEVITAAMDIDGIFSSVNSNNIKTESTESNISEEGSIPIDESYSSTKDSSQLHNWIEKDMNGFQAHRDLWSSFCGALSPAQLLPHVVISLVVSDPRLQIPDRRTKAVPKAGVWKPTCSLSSVNVPPYCGPIWCPNIRDKATASKLSTAEINALRSKQLVPGLVRTENGNTAVSCGNDKYEDASEPTEEPIKPLSQQDQSHSEMHSAKVPLMLIQRPGSQDPDEKRLGFGCGWDVILPAGWAMPFWLAFVFRGARPGGLREADSHLFESSKSQLLPPDTLAGQQEDERMEKELRDKYFRLPPDKRPNFIKLGVACPFRCAWNLLLRDWSTQSDSVSVTNASVFVLRDRSVLIQLSDTLQSVWKRLIKNTKEQNEELLSDSILSIFKSVPNGSSCLIPVKVKAFRRGVTDDRALLCIPTQEDVSHLTGSSNIDPSETVFEDLVHEKRCKLRSDHKKLLTRLRRRRVRAKRKMEETISDSENGSDMETEEPKCKPLAPRAHKSSDLPTKDIVNKHREEMEMLWLPNVSNTGSVRTSGSRETAGFLTKGDFSLTEARGCGVGYIAYNSLLSLIEVWCKYVNRNEKAKLQNRNPIVLVRPPSSFQYRTAQLFLLS